MRLELRLTNSSRGCSSLLGVCCMAPWEYIVPGQCYIRSRHFPQGSVRTDDSLSCELVQRSASNLCMWRWDRQLRVMDKLNAQFVRLSSLIRLDFGVQSSKVNPIKAIRSWEDFQEIPVLVLTLVQPHGLKLLVKVVFEP